MHRLEKELIALARNCPKNGVVSSTRAELILIKEWYGLNDWELCQVIANLRYHGLIQDFQLIYTMWGTIYKYWFK